MCKPTLQKSMDLIPLEPRAGPTGGLGEAWPAPTMSLTICSTPPFAPPLDILATRLQGPSGKVSCVEGRKAIRRVCSRVLHFRGRSVLSFATAAASGGGDGGGRHLNWSWGLQKNRAPGRQPSRPGSRQPLCSKYWATTHPNVTVIAYLRLSVPSFCGLTQSPSPTCMCRLLPAACIAAKVRRPRAAAQVCKGTLSNHPSDCRPAVGGPYRHTPYPGRST